MSAIAVSPHPLATEAGRDVLARGGNAIEAAIAVNAVLAVVYPHFCGLGGDAVWLVSDGQGSETCLLGIGQGIEHGALQDGIPLRGSGSVLTTAAVLDLWDHALHLWPHRWTPTDLLAPAIALAEHGFPVSASQAHWLGFRGAETETWPGFDAVFRPGGHTPAAGDRFAQPQLAATLNYLARSGFRAFYEGMFAQRIIAGLNHAGVPMSVADLAATRTERTAPLRLDYRGLTLLSSPPPTQGLTTLEIMGILALTDLADMPQDSQGHIHLVVEAVKRAFLDRHEIADPVSMTVDGADLLTPDRLARHAAGISDRAMPWPHDFRAADTVYFATVDAEGRCVSALQSTYFDWGSGVVAGDTGILWQNRGAAFNADPAHPNAFAPGKRPFYTLNPGMALADGRPRLLYGTQGADGQPQTLAMLLTRLVDYGSSPEDALAAPRFLLGRTFSDSRDTLKLEAHLPAACRDALADRGHDIATIEALSPLAGQAGIVAIAPDGTLRGAHDPRGEGTALALA